MSRGRKDGPGELQICGRTPDGARPVRSMQSDDCPLAPSRMGATIRPIHTVCRTQGGRVALLLAETKRSNRRPWSCPDLVSRERNPADNSGGDVGSAHQNVVGFAVIYPVIVLAIDVQTLVFS